LATYRTAAPPPPPPRAPSPTPTVILLLGILACFFAAGIGLLHLLYRYEAGKPVVDVSPAELVRRPADGEALRVKLTPQPSRAVSIRAGSDAALLVPVEESPKLALVVRTETTLPTGSIAPSPAREPPPAQTAVFVVHRAQGFLLGDVWGVPRDELRLYAFEDPREQATRNVLFSGVLAGASLVFGIVTAAVGALLLRARRARARARAPN
jgi:hypothetical protein